MDHSEKIAVALAATGKWGLAAARRGVRAGFKCQYCDRNLLASVNDYKEWQEDHIVPLSCGGGVDEENIAVSCRTCNFNVKANWHPRSACRNGASREELILAFRTYVAERRLRFWNDIQVFREIVNVRSS